MLCSCSGIKIKIILFKKVKFCQVPLNFMSHNNNLNVKNDLESLGSLKWCDRYWLIQSHWLISFHFISFHFNKSRISLASHMRHFNQLLSVTRTFYLLECTEWRVSWQCSWAADKFLERCSLTPISNNEKFCHILQWMS